MYSILCSVISVNSESDDIQDGREIKAIEMQQRSINMGENQSKKKGMILPFEPHSICFDEVSYSVDMPQVSYNDY